MQGVRHLGARATSRVFAHKAPCSMESPEAENSDPLIEAVKQVLLGIYTPIEVSIETAKLLTTHQLRDKINAFTAFDLGAHDIHQAMIDAGFKIRNVSGDYYWLLAEK